MSGLPHFLLYIDCYLCIWLSVVVHIGASTLEDESDLRRKLFSNYSRDLRPVYNQSTISVINITFNLQSIQDLDQKKQVLKTAGYLAISWLDELLRWNPEDYGDLTSIVVNPDQIWMPDLLLDNGANGFTKIGGKNFLVSVEYRGLLTWAPGDIHETRCTIDVTFYPFDKQTCFINITSWMYSEYSVNLIAEPSINLAAYTENGEFDISEISAYDETVTYGDVPYSFVVIRLSLERRGLFYIINTILPVLLLSILNALVFTIPPEAGEKMSLSITVLLAYAVFLSIVSEDMPDTSLSVSLLAVYISLVLALGTASIVISAIVLHLHHKVPNTRDLLPCFKRGAKTMPKQALPGGEISDETHPNVKNDSWKEKSSNKKRYSPQSAPSEHDHRYYEDLVNKIDIVSFWLILGLTVSAFLVIIILLTTGV